VFNPEDKTLWVTNARSYHYARGVTVLSAEDGRYIKNIPVGENPKGIVYADNKIWVANYGEGTLQCVYGCPDPSDHDE
jgi:DNA-binding beta-propeller fold protein YncE